MKRSEINNAIKEATEAFKKHDWFLPPNPKWDVTDFGLGNFNKTGLVLINLAEQPEYCEKLMFSKKNQVTPAHYHAIKKEDIICRWGKFAIQLLSDDKYVNVQINGESKQVSVENPIILSAGERITLTSGIRHAFWAVSDYAILGEVSTANDDENDNFFDNPDIGRYSQIEEDEPPVVKLLSDK